MNKISRTPIKLEIAAPRWLLVLACTLFSVAASAYSVDDGFKADTSNSVFALAVQ